MGAKVIVCRPCTHSATRETLTPSILVTSPPIQRLPPIVFTAAMPALDPEPNAFQADPSHQAILEAGTPPTLVKSPPTIKSPLRTSVLRTTLPAVTPCP